MKEKASILIVDDDPGMTDTLADILDELNYDVAVAKDGYRALEMVEKKVYTIAFIDIKMPGINGVATFRKLKYISPSTKVIMMTAYSVEDIVKEALRKGAYDIIYRPLDIDKAVSFIRKAEKGSLVLMVDDNPAACETLKNALIKKNYKVAIAQDSEEAIMLAKKGAYDIVFIDVKMPVLNGSETYLGIKEVNPIIITVIVTGSKHEGEVSELIEEVLKKAGYTFLYKPLNMDKAIALVEEICKKRKLDKASRNH